MKKSREEYAARSSAQAIDELDRRVERVHDRGGVPAAEQSEADE